MLTFAFMKEAGVHVETAGMGERIIKERWKWKALLLIHLGALKAPKIGLGRDMKHSGGACSWWVVQHGSIISSVDK